MRAETQQLLVRFAAAMKPGLMLDSLAERKFTLSRDPLITGETKIDGETVDDLIDEALRNASTESPKIQVPNISQIILNQSVPFTQSDTSQIPPDIQELLGEDGMLMISDFLDQISQHPFSLEDPFGVKKVWMTRSYSWANKDAERLSSEELVRLLTAALEMRIIKCLKIDPVKFKIELEPDAYYHLIEIFAGS